MFKIRHFLESALTHAWTRRGLLALALWPISLIFRIVVTIRRVLYSAGVFKTSRLPVPVIVIGNIFVGGTGKTPLVIWLASRLREAGFSPGIITRGYGAHTDKPAQITPTSLPQESGDEPLLIAQRTGCPVMIGRDRASVGRAMLNAYPNVNIIISDDGLQHYALARDIEIMLFDERGTGNGWMLPAGPLREPASRARDFTIINAPPENPTDRVAYMQLIGTHAKKLSDRTQSVALSELTSVIANKLGRTPRLLAAAGIGNPSRFFSQLRIIGLQFDELPLPDHFDYKTSPFKDKDADIILITEKDAVKCAVFESPENIGRLWVVPVSAQLDAVLAERIVERCRGSRIA